MPILDIDGLTVPVQLGTGEEATEDLTRRRPRFSGNLGVSVVNGVSFARRWSVETAVDMSTADLDELEARLMQPGGVTLSGDLIGESVACEPVGISRTEGPVDTAGLAFELREVSP